MATSSRESRRRRIVDGGSDRLAFITGQIRNLPPPPPPPPPPSLSPSPSPSESQPRLDGSLPDLSPPHDQILLGRATASPSNEDTASVSRLHKSNHIGSTEQNLYKSSTKSTPSQINTERSTIAPASESRGRTQPYPISSTNQNPSVSHLVTEKPMVSWAHLPKLFTRNQINTAIDASEYTRLLCSVTVALLVVLSLVGFPLLGSIISLRPVFLLLLTNLTVVIGRLLLDNHQGGSSTSVTEENNAGVMNGQDLAEQVGNAIEIALMMQKVMDVVFMDFSIYAIIVICGFSFT